MSTFNKVILMGHLARDPEMRYAPNGTAVCRLTLALNSQWVGNDGEKKEEVSFVDCTFFGKQGETLGQYVKKGNPLFVDGRLKQETWEKEGRKNSKLTVIGESFRFIGKREQQSEAAPATTPELEPSRPTPRPTPKPPTEVPPPEEDDVPF